MGTVIRNVSNDRVAGAAVRAIGERISMPPVAGILEIHSAILASSHVWRHKSKLSRRRHALANGEMILAERLDARDAQPVDASQGRQLGFERRKEAVYRVFIPFDLDRYSLGRVQNKAAHTE